MLVDFPQTLDESDDETNNNPVDNDAVEHSPESPPAQPCLGVLVQKVKQTVHDLGTKRKQRSTEEGQPLIKQKKPCLTVEDQPLITTKKQHLCPTEEEQPHIANKKPRLTEEAQQRITHNVNQKQQAEKERIVARKLSKKHCFTQNGVIDDSETSDIEPDSDCDSTVEPDDDIDRTTTSDAHFKRSFSMRVKWSQKELDALKKVFAKFLHGPKLPGWNDIDKLIDRHSFFSNRTKKQIKARFVHLKKTGR